MITFLTDKVQIESSEKKRVLNKNRYCAERDYIVIKSLRTQYNNK